MVLNLTCHSIDDLLMNVYDQIDNVDLFSEKVYSLIQRYLVVLLQLNNHFYEDD